MSEHQTSWQMEWRRWGPLKQRLFAMHLFGHAKGDLIHELAMTCQSFKLLTSESWKMEGRRWGFLKAELSALHMFWPREPRSPNKRQMTAKGTWPTRAA